MHTVLLIEDDAEITALLETYLQRYGFSVFGITHPSVALQKLQASHYDLILLDLTLPEQDGLSLCKTIKANYPDTPLIISTARGDVSDKVIGFDAGADDYIAKPYDPRELAARMQTLIKRFERLSPAAPASPFQVDTAKLRITQEGEILDLTLAEFEIFALLLSHPHRVLSREFILNSVNAVDWESSDKSINVLISRIRQKIGDDTKQPRYIRTVRGVGYQYVGV